MYTVRLAGEREARKQRHVYRRLIINLNTQLISLERGRVLSCL
jgi:hypothetical protein